MHNSNAQITKIVQNKQNLPLCKFTSIVWIITKNFDKIERKATINNHFLENFV